MPELAQSEVLTLSFCAEEGLLDGTSSAVVRIKGRRVGAEGRASSGDQFVREETLADIPAGSGRLSITTRVDDVEPGEWQESAVMVPQPSGRAAKHRGRVAEKPIALPLAE